MSTLSMNEVTTYRWTLEEDLRRYREFGYEGIGLWRRKLEDYGLPGAVELVAESGLKVTHLGWAGGFTGSDGRTYDDAVRDALGAIRLAAQLEAECLVLYSGGRNNHTFRHAERLLTAAIDELLDYAIAADVVLALEPIHHDCAAEWSFLTEPAEALAVVERFGCDHLKLALDAYHFGDSPEVLANLGELARHAALIHLADRQTPRCIDQSRCALGEGSIPWVQFATGLIEAGFAGDFDVKIFGPEVSPSDYESLLTGAQQAGDVWAPVRGR